MIDSLVCISLILVRAWRWEAYGSILHPPLWRNGKGGGGRGSREEGGVLDIPLCKQATELKDGEMENGWRN